MQALFGQLLVGLINGSFYALLSLGLAIIFGLGGPAETLGGAGHDDKLIDIRHQDLLPTLAGAAEDVLPRLDSLNERVAGCFGAEINDVAGHHDVPQVGAEVF